MKHFRNSFIFTWICLVLAFVLGWSGDWLHGALSTLFIVAVLGILEVSLSFDNAVVDAGILKNMDDKWRNRFLTWWVLISVVGMRVIFPILLVAIFGHLDPWHALQLALHDQQQYSQILSMHHHSISWFGGAFLMMVWLKFFFDSAKDIHWLHYLEKKLTKLGKIEAVEVVAVLLILVWVSSGLEATHAHEFLISGIWGLILYVIIHWISEMMHAGHGAGSVAKQGMMAFIYLELLDASFSLDGVIGAFALSTNLFVIALWLWIGAFFVRSITMYLYKTGKLTEYRYLEHGAFYAIIALSLMMFIGTLVHIPEVITGLVWAALIGLSLYSSLRFTKKSE
jgi:uncharacterized protein